MRRRYVRFRMRQTRLLKQTLLCLHINVRLEEPHISFCNFDTFEALINFRLPLHRWALEDRDNRVVSASPQGELSREPLSVKGERRCGLR